jgi:hypothetical protein
VNWLLHIIGLDNPAGRWELFWSGFGSDVGEAALLGAAFAFWRRHTCHVDTPRYCWRWAAHPVTGTPFRACKKHHPQVPDRISAEHIQAAHDDARKEVPHADR